MAIVKIAGNSTAKREIFPNACGMSLRNKILLPEG